MDVLLTVKVSEQCSVAPYARHERFAHCRSKPRERVNFINGPVTKIHKTLCVLI